MDLIAVHFLLDLNGFLRGFVPALCQAWNTDICGSNRLSGEQNN
jgi:hypothetical protein